VGTLLGHSVSDLIKIRMGMYNARGVRVWAELADVASRNWRSHAPVSWRELQGMRRAGLTQEQLCMLGSDFEMQMLSWSDDSLWAASESYDGTSESKAPGGRCTAFAITDAHQLGPLCGQNVDEEPSGWLHGSRDMVIRHVGDPDGSPDVLLYTHPGVPAYCGMNSSGLAVLNLFIEDGCRNSEGVPIDAAIRDVLCRRSIEDAVSYLEGLPRIAPTTYMLVQGDSIATVEASARRTATAWIRGPGESFHSNHPLLDQRMAGDNGSPSRSSLSRLDCVGEAVRKAHSEGTLDVDAAKRILEKTEPAHKKIAPTMARVVMEPDRGMMHVQFYGELMWTSVGFADHDAE